MRIRWTGMCFIIFFCMVLATSFALAGSRAVSDVTTHSAVKPMDIPATRPAPKVVRGTPADVDYYVKTHSVRYYRLKDSTYRFTAKVTNKGDVPTPEGVSQRYVFDIKKNKWIPASGRVLPSLAPQSTKNTDGTFTYDPLRFTKIKFVIFATGENQRIIGEDIFKLNLPTLEEKETVAVELPHE